jgi:ABC-type dipeptide/oligopeptide/nickel transport system permease component
VARHRLMFINAITGRDSPVIMGYVLLFGR